VLGVPQWSAVAVSSSATFCQRRLQVQRTPLALIDFPSLAAYEQYREALMADNEALDNVARAEKSGCILNEDRSFLQRVP